MSNDRLASLSAALDWEQANRGFQFDRTNVSRKYEYYKIKSSKDADGILNYRKRLGPLAAYFKKDFLDAHASIGAISIGLDKIYGFSVPAPNPGDLYNLLDNRVDCASPLLTIITGLSGWTKPALSRYLSGG